MSTGKLHVTKMPHQNLSRCKALFYITVLLCCLTITEGHISLKYSEVDRFGSSCPVLDSCEYRKSINTATEVKGLNCGCDYLCSEYGDCCIDSSKVHTESNNDIRKCFEVPQLGGIYMEDSCSPEYKGCDDVRDLCQKTKLGNQADPLASLPITDALTGITYKNYYCSMCNNKSDNMILWTLKLECPLLALFNDSKKITDDYVLQSLTTHGENWGLYLEGEGNSPPFFHDCEVSPVLPKQLENKIRLCTPHLVSDCPPSWGNEDIREMCKLYTGARFVQGGDLGYKNVHCAICNGINVTELSCQSPAPDILDIFRFDGTLSFAHLMDINEATGSQVGKIKVCETGDVFDPFFKKCRSLSCLPGFVRRGRTCFPRRRFLRKLRVKKKIFVNQPSFLASNVISTSAKPSDKSSSTRNLPFSLTTATSTGSSNTTMNTTTYSYMLNAKSPLSFEAVNFNHG